MDKRKISKFKWTHSPYANPEYYVWQGMIRRCTKSNATGYKYYGKRGISVCYRWLVNFDNFMDDMGKRPTPKHTLDRIDKDGDYEPSNCIWATWTVQAVDHIKDI